MNTKVLILALSVAALSSCSTAYKMGQTPDDVYFSPAREQDEYVAVEQQEDRYYAPGRSVSPNRYEPYDEYNNFRNDRFLRMSIGSRYRSSMYDDFYWNDGMYGSNNWKYNNYGYGLNSPWNSYSYWNNFYNPYNRFNYYYPYNGYGNGYNNVIIGNVKAPVFNASRPRSFNPGSYTNSYNNNNRYLDRNAIINSRPSNTNANSGNRYNNRNGFSNGLRRVFSSPDNSGYYNNSNRTSSSTNRSSNNNSFTPSRNSSSDAPVRSYTPSSSSSSSSSSGSSSGGVSRPTRGGN